MEARKHYPIAQLQAAFMEVFFPRYLTPDPDAKEPAKPPRPRKPWTPEELIPYYASFGDTDPLPVEAARALLEHFDALPAWARELAPVTAAVAAAGHLTPGESRPG